jgi:hypothetical protein
MIEIGRISRGLDRALVSAGDKVVLSAVSGKSVTLLDAKTRQATRASLSLANGEYPGEFVWTPGGAVALMLGPGGSMIVSYKVVP